MSRKSPPSIHKREREARKAEKARRKQERRARLKESASPLVLAPEDVEPSDRPSESPGGSV
jgi:hypothetical protein